MHGGITMNADLVNLIKSLGDGYSQQAFGEGVTGGISIGTPFLDGNNDGIEVYAWQLDDSTIEITDDGFTFAGEYDYLLEHALFIAELLKSYPNVRMFGRQIVCQTKKETFVQDFYVYMSALMHLVGFFEHGERWQEWHDRCCDKE